MIKEEFVTVMKPIKELVKRECICDLCGGVIDRNYYSKDVSKIIIREGHAYPEYVSYIETKAYFCKVCSNKIKDTLENIGVKFNTKEIEF